MRELYGTDPESLLNLISKTDESLDTLMLVGHNPTWEVFGSLLIGGGDIRMPTGALACFKLQTTSWKQVHFGSAILSWLVTPKLLAKAFPSK